LGHVYSTPCTQIDEGGAGILHRQSTVISSLLPLVGVTMNVALFWPLLPSTSDVDLTDRGGV